MSERLEIGQSEIAVSPERIQPVKPVVVTSVTLGKELHAGHMLLLATADLVREGLGSRDPIILVNNNTGPRAAGALVALSQESGLTLKETASMMSAGQVDVGKIVAAYRGRIEKGEIFDQAFDLLDSGLYDIFAGVAKGLTPELKRAGFTVKIVPESNFLGTNHEVVEKVNPIWNGSGFLFSLVKGINVLQQGGQFTATGKAFISLAALMQDIGNLGETPFVVFVDGSADTHGAVATCASMPELGKAFQFCGAAIGFEGQMASGSKGEAVTLGRLVEAFNERCPQGNIKVALRRMVLIMPVVVPFAKAPNLAVSFYDFKDNNKFVEELARCQKDADQFQEKVNQWISALGAKVGKETTAADPKVARWLSFLPQRTKSTLQTQPESIIGAMGKVQVLESQEDIAKVVDRQGYHAAEADRRVLEYMNGPKGLVLQGNYFLGLLENTKRNDEQITSLSPDDFAMLKMTIQFCMERLGYEEN